MVIAGSWLIASVKSERTTQMSSAMPAVCGSSSLNIVPLLPAGANLNIEFATGNFAWPDDMPVSRWPLRIVSGRSEPRSLSSAGLWSNSSICDGAPDWQR